MHLSTIENIAEDDIVFHKAKEQKAPNSKIKYERLKIESKLPNGKLILHLSLKLQFYLFSYGINERRNKDTDKLTGYSIPVCLWKKDGEPNEKEENFFNILKKIQDICRDHLAEEYGEKEASSFGEILYCKQIEYTNEKGKLKKKKDKSSAPILYVKLFFSEETKKISTIFKTKGNQDVKPWTILENTPSQEWQQFSNQFIFQNELFHFKSKHMKFISNQSKKENHF